MLFQSVVRETEELIENFQTLYIAVPQTQVFSTPIFFFYKIKNNYFQTLRTFFFLFITTSIFIYFFLFINLFLPFSLGTTMRPEKNPLDLNNFPEDYSSRGDGKQVHEDTSSSVVAGGYSRKKKSGGKEENGKVYQCRFCSLKFCKSQALGGHMNRHRQERETETLNRARQLVFSNDNLASPHLGGHPVTNGGGFHHQQQPQGNIIAEPATIPFRSTIYQPKLYQSSANSPSQPYLYASPPSRLMTTYPSSQYNPHHSLNEYYMGHVLSTTSNLNPNPNPNLNMNMGSLDHQSNNYTCIGAPVGRGFEPGTHVRSDMASLQNPRRVDSFSPIINNRFNQDGF